MGSAAVTWTIYPYELNYEIVCAPKVYDGTVDANVESIKFFNPTNQNIVALTENDYRVNSIKYDRANVGRNYGDEAVSATADVGLIGSAGSNYTLYGGTGIRTDKSKRCCTENCKRPHLHTDSLYLRRTRRRC